MNTINTIDCRQQFEEVLKVYGVNGAMARVEPYGNGHINDTMLVTPADGRRPFILQKINTAIFRQPTHLMENVHKVTEWIRKKMCSEKGSAGQEALRIVPTTDGGLYCSLREDIFYRAYEFVEGVCLDLPRNKEDFYESGVAFGRFQRYLSDFPVEELYDTIPDFHNTEKRFEALLMAVEEDRVGRAAAAADDIAFALSEKDAVDACMECKRKLPVRVTHNDTKLNNVMLNPASGKAVCVLDLDTVMPGYAMDDFGDAIRFGASNALEDEKDLSRVWMDMDMFEVFTEGFLSAAEDGLTPEEIRQFPLGAKMMTYECGIRFLTDYLQGDVYFKTGYPEHNLVRARNQFALVKDMNRKMEEMKRIVEAKLKP
ncbi:MAG: aminoglycoside phosphotransferase family protein [Lachnospiraceae bacterium]|nr:aminoglycoside phosphotransferase family protein [Lachnospiraceae bacterium]